MKTLYFGSLAIVCIIAAYSMMKEHYKRSKKALETQTFSYGLFYSFKPATGDKAIRLARSYAVIGQVLFYFAYFFCIIAFILLAL